MPAFFGQAGRLHHEQFKEGQAVAATVIAKRCSPQGGLSIVDWRGAREVFAVAAASGGSTFERQAAEALGTIDAAARSSGAQGSIVQQTVFLADLGLVDRCRQIVRAFYGEHLPATTYVPQPPCDGSMLAIEAVALAPAVSQVQVRRPSERLVIARHDGIDWLFCALVDSCLRPENAYRGATDVLGQIRTLLRGAGADFDQVLRTWLYLGGIVAGEGRTQRYQELNQARDEFYREISFLGTAAPHRNAYPASTGIGMSGRGLTAGAIARAGRPGRRDDQSAGEPPANRGLRLPGRLQPQRTAVLAGHGAPLRPASDDLHLRHGEHHLVGDAPPERCRRPNRGDAGQHRGPDRRGKPRRARTAGIRARPAALASARVYVKRKEDYEAIRTTCTRRLGELPAVYVLADVCRPELLVEIEGVAFSSKTAGGADPAGSPRRILLHPGHPLPAAHDPALGGTTGTVAVCRTGP